VDRKEFFPICREDEIEEEEDEIEEEDEDEIEEEDEDEIEETMPRCGLRICPVGAQLRMTNHVCARRGDALEAYKHLSGAQGVPAQTVPRNRRVGGYGAINCSHHAHHAQHPVTPHFTPCRAQHCNLTSRA
jgi:hypothetical protein